MRISGEGDTHTLRMSFEGKAQTFMAKLMSGLMGRVFKGAMRKAILQDLGDIKAAVEKAGKD